MTLHQGDPYSTHRRRTPSILAPNVAASPLSVPALHWHSR